MQRAWDRHLSRVPILLIVVGSDLSTMEMLGQYDRPLYQRMREIVVEPFNPAELAEMLRLEASEAFDAYLTVGGFPTLARAWSDATRGQFLESQLTDSASPLVVAGERILGAEFPPGLQAREILQVVGSGETTFTAISSRTGINQGTLTRSMQALVRDKRTLAQDYPLSGRAGRNARYRVADPYLRFWLRFIGPNLELLLRERGDLVREQIERAWANYRGKAVEPLVRAAFERMLPDGRFGDAQYVGSFWNRNNSVEVDLVGATKPQSPTSVAFVGSVKWRKDSPFDRKDVANLAVARAAVPGAEDAPMVGVSRSGFTTKDLDVSLNAEDLLEVWKPR